jgi:hypothetical protein
MILPQQGSSHLEYKESIIALMPPGSMLGKSVWRGRGVRVGGRVAVGFLVGNIVAVAVFSGVGVAETCVGGETVIEGRNTSSAVERHPYSHAAIAITRMATTIMWGRFFLFMEYTPAYIG